jgi:hypothetical protein
VIGIELSAPRRVVEGSIAIGGRGNRYRPTGIGGRIALKVCIARPTPAAITVEFRELLAREAAYGARRVNAALGRVHTRRADGRDGHAIEDDRVAHETVLLVADRRTGHGGGYGDFASRRIVATSDAGIARYAALGGGAHARASADRHDARGRIALALVGVLARPCGEACSVDDGRGERARGLVAAR